MLGGLSGGDDGQVVISILANEKDAIQGFKSVFSAITDLEKKGDRAAASFKMMSKVGDALTVGVTVPLLAIGGAATAAAVSFEDAFAGVVKTVDATGGELATLKQGFRDMAKEIPLSANEIASIGEAAGQLGIEVPNIMGFTRVMADLGVATNMSSTDAATALARLANITQMSQKDFDRLGSSVVELGNNLATTESEIVEMGLRLAGAGKQIGLTEAQIMGISGALSSVGIEAEAGGSAFSKVMINMQLAAVRGGEDLANFANVAGMSADQFKTKFEQDAAGALIAFVSGLGKMEEQGSSAIEALDAMGISEVRMRDALLRASGAGELMAKSIGMSTDAWKENNALTKEATTRYDTAKSKMIIMKNKVIDLGISMGDKLLPYAIKLIDSIGDLVDWFGSLDDGTKDLIVNIGIFAAAIGPVSSILGRVGGGVTNLVGLSKSLVTGLQNAGGATGMLSSMMGSLSAATGMSAASLMGIIAPVGLVVAAVAALGIAYAAHEAKMQSFDGANEVTNGALGNLRDALSSTKEVTLDFTNTSVTELERLSTESQVKMGNVVRAVNEAALAMEEYTKGLSDDAASAVESYTAIGVAVNGTLTKSIEEYGVVTKEVAAQALLDTQNGSTQILSVLEKEKNDKIAILNETKEKSATMTDEQYATELEKINTWYDTKSTTIGTKEAEIYEILARASNENRNLTAEETAVVQDLIATNYADIASLTGTSEAEIQSIRDGAYSTLLAGTAKVNSEALTITKKALEDKLAAEYTSLDELKNARSVAYAEGNTELAKSYDADIAALEASTKEKEGQLLNYETALRKAVSTDQTERQKQTQAVQNLTKEVQTGTGQMIGSMERTNTQLNNLNKTPLENKNATYTVNWAQTGSKPSSMGISPSIQIPQNALGTRDFSGGWTNINERGDEVAYLPSGSTILPATLSKTLMRQYGREMAISQSNEQGGTNSEINLVLQLLLGDKTLAEVAKSIEPEVTKKQTERLALG